MTEHRAWLKSYPDGVPKTLEPYPETSLFSVLEESARRFPDRPAIAWFGRHISYKDLLKEVEKFSALLAKLGVKQGDRVGLILPNCPQYVIAYYATVRLGAIIVGNNPLYTARELSHQLNDAGCDVVVVLDQLYANLEAIKGEVNIRRVIVTGLEDYMPFPKNLLAPLLVFRKQAKKEGRPWPPVPKGASVTRWKSIDEAKGEIPPPAEVNAKEDPAGFIYTGGTTGLSKGAMLSHFNIVSNCMQGAAWFPDLVDGQEAVMCVLPFFHSYGMTVCMNIGIYKAAKLVLRLHNRKGRVLASWSRSVKAGAAKLKLVLPAKARKAGVYTMNVAISDPSRTRTRCDTSSACDRSATRARGIPSWRVTMRPMSTAALPMRSMARMTESTDAMASASRGERAATTATAPISCTSSDNRPSSSSTSSAMSGSPK